MNNVKQNDRRRWMLPCMVLLMIGVLSIALWFGLREKEPASDPTQLTTVTQSQTVPLTPSSTGSSTETQGTVLVTEPVDVTQPSATVPTTVVTEPSTSTPDREPTVPLEQLVCEFYSLYSGAFVEDGSDEPVENVAALLITNGSTRYLDLAQLTFDLDGREAIFTVTGLPSGASAWVLEKNRMSADADTTFTHKNTQTSFRTDAINELEGLELAFSGTMLKATNTTDQPLKNVTVYYKNLHEDGNFLGGITYMTTFGNLEPGQSAEKLAGHFQPDKSQIVRIGYTS